MRFSLILASRGRPEILHQLCNSLQSNTIDLANIELLIGIDSDDQATISKCQQLVQSYSWVKPHSRMRGTNIARDYHNWLLARSKGKYLFVLNDDVEVETYGWDAIASLRFEMHMQENKNLTYGQTGPAHGNGYSEFPMVTREAARALGFLMPEEHPNWGADSFLFNIYHEAGLIANMTDIRLKHTRYEDETRHGIWGRFNDTVGGNDTHQYSRILLQEKTNIYSGLML